jgi:hypothetical protein
MNLEIAAVPAWWDKLTYEEQKQYVKEHPKTKLRLHLKSNSLQKKLKTIINVQSKIIPMISSAVKLSNYIVKHYGATYDKPFGIYSNPYSDVQQRDHKISKSNADLLEKHLEQQGWEKKDVSKYYLHDIKANEFDNKVGGSIVVVRTKSAIGVKVFGKKKAKPSTIPYYD